MINLENEMRNVSVGHLSLFIYPWRRLEEDARLGDLFTCHLVYEAKPIFDPEGYLPRLQHAFQFRSNYQDDIERASDLGWYLVRYGDELNPALLAKRALWCIRTVLIARSAERRVPVFAPRQLAQQTPSQPARELLNARHHPPDDNSLLQALRSFLETEAASASLLVDADKSVFLGRFVATSNKVALQTLKQQEKSREGYL